jgi:hypothetical protein
MISDSTDVVPENAGLLKSNVTLTDTLEADELFLPNMVLNFKCYEIIFSNFLILDCCFA